MNYQDKRSEDLCIWIHTWMISSIMKDPIRLRDYFLEQENRGNRNYWRDELTRGRILIERYIEEVQYDLYSLWKRISVQLPFFDFYINISFERIQLWQSKLEDASSLISCFWVICSFNHNRPWKSHLVVVTAALAFRPCEDRVVYIEWFVEENGGKELPLLV